MANALLVVPVEVRPRLQFVPMGEGAAWVIHRRYKDGRYRWSARLHIEGVRRTERAEGLAEHAARIEQFGRTGQSDAS